MQARGGVVFVKHSIELIRQRKLVNGSSRDNLELNFQRVVFMSKDFCGRQYWKLNK